MNTLKQLADEMCRLLKATMNINLKPCRDSYTGFYLPEIFVELAEREMALSDRSGEPFSIVKLYLGQMDSIEGHFGHIFVKELEMNLGLFVQSRVRSSDLVAKGNRGEIMVLLARLPRELALLVGERLRHAFSREACFMDHSTQKNFEPRLEYEIQTYPHEIRTVGDVRNFIAKALAPAEKGSSTRLSQNS